MFVLELLADDENGYDEITPFVRAFKKIYDDSHKVGFTNRFTPNEKTVLRGIWEKIEKDAHAILKEADKKTGPGAQSSGV